jgi:hypothetical protein
MSIKTKDTRLYFAIVYTIALFGVAYYYSAPNKNALALLEKTQISTFEKSDIAIGKGNDATLQSILETIKSVPRYTEPYTKAKYINNSADRLRAMITDLENQYNDNPVTQKERALQIVQMFYKKIEKTFEKNKHDRENFEDKLLNLDNLKKIKSAKLYFQALRSTITSTEYDYLLYHLHECTRGDVKPDAYIIASQLENHCVKEGEFVKGWFGFGVINTSNNIEISINGKPFPTLRGTAIYKTKPQAAGKYPLVITSTFMVHDSLIRVCDTLYYTVR